jgi:hypothetical protein
MLSALLLPLVAVASHAPAVTAGPALADPPIKVWLNEERFARGERARVFVRADRDGYVVVLHAEPGGRVRVLFPLDPTDDNYVRAGKKYEIRGRGDRDAFTVYDTRGTGMVLAAFSPDPFRFDSFVRQDHWDYRVDAFRVGDDPEADLTELVRQMVPNSEFDYDAVRYEATERVAYQPWSSPWWYDSWWYGGWYRPWRSGVFIGIGFGPAWSFSCWTCASFYDPWFFDPFWGPLYYHRVVRYRPYYVYPYWWWDAWWYRPYYASPTVVIANYYFSPYAYRGLAYRTPNPFGVRRYGLSYVQPGRRILSLYTPGQNVIEPRSRSVQPPTDIVGPAVVRIPVKETAPASGPGTPRRLGDGAPAPAGSPDRPASPRDRQPPGGGQAPAGGVEPRRVEPRQVEPRRAEPRRVEPGRGEPRPIEPRAAEPRRVEPRRVELPPARPEPPRTIREIPSRESVPQAPQGPAEPRRWQGGPAREWAPASPQRFETPRLERRLPARDNPPAASGSFEPRARMPSVLSSPRGAGPGWMRAPGAGMGSPAPRLVPRLIPSAPGRRR